MGLRTAGFPRAGTDDEISSAALKEILEWFKAESSKSLESCPFKYISYYQMMLCDSDVVSEWVSSRLWLPDCVTILFCEDVSGWALGERFWITHAKHLISIRAATRRSLSQTVSVFWKGVATSADTISKLSLLTDWQLTRHALWGQDMTVQEMALSVSALAPRNNTSDFCEAVYVMAAEPIKCSGDFFF